MWRAKGAGEFYTYLPPSFRENKKLCNVKPFSECNPTYGASVGRGAFTFATGRWTTVAERIRLNDIGQANGELELFADGKSVVKVDGLVLRDKDEGRMRGIQMQTFFGGVLSARDKQTADERPSLQDRSPTLPLPRTRMSFSQIFPLPLSRKYEL